MMRLHAAGAKVRIFADPMQSIYVKGAKARAAHAHRWRDLCGKADLVEELDIPHRWANGSRNSGSGSCGRAWRSRPIGPSICARTGPTDWWCIWRTTWPPRDAGGVSFEAQSFRPVRKAITAAASMMVLAEKMTLCAV